MFHGAGEHIMNVHERIVIDPKAIITYDPANRSVDA